MTIKLFLQILIGAGSYGVWAFMAYHDPAQRADFLKFNVALAMGTVGLVVRDMASPATSAPTVTETVSVGDRSRTVTSPAPPPGQSGSALVHLLWVVAAFALGLALLGLAGCASLTEAGHVAYKLEPVMGADGKPSGDYALSVSDGKEFSSRSINMMKSGGGVVLNIEEGASSAFQGQAIAGKALAILPSFAAPILTPGPASAAIVTKP